jgi:C_GCAxxG_C_C family probable redox protein
MSTKSQIAALKFISGYNCAQSVFFAFCNELGIDKTTALKLACGFGGGMGRKGEVCGAVTGGILVLGAKFGRGEKEDRSVTDFTYQKTRELMDRIVAKHGTFICRRLLDGCELTSEVGQKQFKDNDYMHKICVPCVESVVEIIEEIL